MSSRIAVVPAESYSAVAQRGRTRIRRNPGESNESQGLPDGRPVRVSEKAKAQVTIMYTQPDGPSDSSSTYQSRLYQPQRAASAVCRKQGTRP